MDVLAAMDRFVHRTGLYRMTLIDRPEPRPLRWFPLLVLVALACGYPLMLGAGGTRGGWIGIAAGSLLFWGAYGIAGYLRFFGPRLVEDTRTALDERERLVKARAGALSGVALAIAAVLFCLYQGCAVALGWPRVGQPSEWFFLGLGVQGAWMALPVLVASWLQPRWSADDEA